MTKKVIKKKEDGLFYTTGGGNVFITARVTNRQKATYTVKLDGITKFSDSSAENVEIGTQAECKGKLLFVEANCTHTNGSTRVFPFTITLSDDASNKEPYDNTGGPESENTIENDGDTLLYQINIDLK